MEESTLAQLTPTEIRSDIFAWYTLLGTAGTALGTIVCGWLVQGMIGPGHQEQKTAYRSIFWIYAGLGIIKLILSLLLSEACEPEPPKQEYHEVVEMEERSDSEHEAEGLLSSSDEKDDDGPEIKIESNGRPARKTQTQPSSSSSSSSPRTRRSIWPAISPSSRTTLVKMCALFAIDSLASGLVPQSWIVYFFKDRYRISQGQLGSLFFVTNIIAAVSNLFASSLAKRIGLVKTMVFTHLPAAILLAMIPLPGPNLAWLAMLFLIIRSCIQNMDQAPRQAFISIAVLPSERTAVMGVVNVVKTLSQSGGPVVTGWLGGIGKFWIAFLVAGGLKAGYDLGMLKMFLGFKGREEQENNNKNKQRSPEEEESK